MQVKKRQLWALLLVSLAANTALVVLQLAPKQDASATNHSLPFLSQRIFVEAPNDMLINFTNLRGQLREYIADSPDAISVYFDYLPSGVSIGINDTNKFYVASLLKIPVAMAVMRLVETGDMRPDERLTVSPEEMDGRFGEIWPPEKTSITVMEAMKLSLSASSNTAHNVLYTAMLRHSTHALSDVFDALDIARELQDERPVVTAKNYSSILRSLYLASFLSREHSNDILRMLSESTSHDRLAAGIPKGVVFAHKIGVFEDAEAKQSVYSDCGIVYVPKRPFILCVMSNTENLDRSKNYMRDIARMTYDYVVKASPTPPGEPAKSY